MNWIIYRLEPLKGRTERWVCANKITALNLRDTLRGMYPSNTYVIRWEHAGNFTPITEQRA
jgi:hypothetical protein